MQRVPATVPRSRAWIARCALVVSIAIAAGLFAKTGRFVRAEVNDTLGYSQFDFSSWNGIFTSIRTPGYPLFLRAVARVSASPAAVPVAQFVMFAAAVWTFFEVLLRLTHRAWLSWLIASSLLSTSIFVNYSNTIATETPAAAIAVLCSAALLWWTASPRPALLLAIGGLVIAGWLVRPVGVFLVVWVPLIGAWLAAWRSTDAAALPAERQVSPGGALLRLSLVTVVPLFLWVTFRGAMFGHWGVACFDGYNLIGLAGQLVTPETAERMSPGHQKVIEAAFANRARRENAGGWYVSEPRLHYLRIEYNHDHTIWNDYLPPARELVGNDTRALNAFLSELSWCIVCHQPADYALWLAKATRQAVRKVFSDTLQHPLSLALLLICIPLSLMAPRHVPPTPAVVPYAASVLRLMAVLAVSYAVVNLLCTIPFVPPRERMTDAAALWGPSLLAAWLGSLLARWSHEK